MPGFLWRVLNNALDLAAIVLCIAAILVIAAAAAVATYMQTGSDIWAGAAVAVTIIVSVAVMEEVL